MDEMEITNKFQRIKDLVDLSWSLTKNILVYIPSILGSDSQPANLPGSKHKLCTINQSSGPAREKWQSLFLRSLGITGNELKPLKDSLACVLHRSEILTEYFPKCSMPLDKLQLDP